MTPAEAVTTLYRHAAKAAHPDTGGSTAAMVEVNAAAELLRQSLPSAQQGPGFTGAGWQRYEAPRAPQRPAAADERLPFGKYKGRTLAAVPLDYLSWMITKMDSAKWRTAASIVMTWRMGG